MRRQGVTNPEPAQGSQRPGLRGPGAEVLRLIGYPVVRPRKVRSVPLGGVPLALSCRPRSTSAAATSASGLHT